MWLGEASVLLVHLMTVAVLLMALLRYLNAHERNAYK